MLVELTSIERPITNWLSAGAKANTGATGVASDQKMVIQADGSVMFECDPNQPYGDGYWYNRLLKSHPELASELIASKDFTLGLRILIKKADFANTRAVEFEIQSTHNGGVSNMAWQGHLGYKWKTFDYANSRWEDLPFDLPCNIQPDVETHVYYNAIKTSTGIRHVLINIDGKTFVVNVDQPLAYKNVSDSVNVGFQLDCQKGTYAVVDGVVKWTPPGPARAFVHAMNFKSQ